MKIKKFENNVKAFSLVELMISLITISLIAAAFAPVITKKLSNGAITVGSFGGSGIIETSTAPQSQKDCNTVGAQLVYVETNETQHTGICVTQYNIGDGNFQIPTGSIDENILAGESKPDGYCNDKKCCWHGPTTGSGTCNSTNGSYSGCNRTICNYEAAKSICENLSYGGYSNWRLPNEKEAEYFEKYSTDLKNNGLMLCAVNITGNSICETQRVCYGGVPSSTFGYVASDCHPPDIWLNNMSYLYFLDNNQKGINAAERYKHHKLSTRCVLGAITVKTVSESSCPAGSFLNSDNACISCTTIDPNCASCSGGVCLTCSNNFVVNKNGKCEDPNKKSCTITFGEAGDKQFTIPSDVDSMEVTLVSGGNGGNGGSGTLMTHTFVTTGTGNSANNATNLLTVNNTGIIDYIIPNEIKNKNVLVTACGGGGGGSQTSAGGNGGIIANIPFLMPNQNIIKIHIGGYGGFGANDDEGYGGNGGCSLGGGGGSSFGSNTSEYTSSCNSINSWGKGGYGASKGPWRYNNGTAGSGGYDPIYNQNAVNGGNGGSYYQSSVASGGKGGNGSYIAGGGGGGTGGIAGGGGGAATLFFHEEYANNSNYVASGGGGGGGGGVSAGGGGGGGGGGIGAGDGGSAGAPGTSGKNKATLSNNIFGSGYCYGGTTRNNGKPGAMRITYIGADTTSTGGLGGGTGAIVPLQTVDLTTNDYISSGETLKIHVGAGGAGGISANIADDGTVTTSGGAGSSGGETYIANNSNVKILATKGMQSGSSAGYITNGKNTTQITVENFSSSNGSANNNKAGGNGGTIILNGEEFTGGAGATATANGASAAIGNYGAGGGGGYSLYAGGNGADGYAKIKFMTSSANCTTAKAEIAYNDFIENKNNIFIKIKLALIQFKDFIVALFNPTIKCKTCMK